MAEATDVLTRRMNSFDVFVTVPVRHKGDCVLCHVTTTFHVLQVLYLTQESAAEYERLAAQTLIDRMRGMNIPTSTGSLNVGQMIVKDSLGASEFLFQLLKP